MNQEVRVKDKQQSFSSCAIASSVDRASPMPLPQLQEEEQKRFNCFYCGQAYSDDKECVNHIGSDHPGKMYYPISEDFENRL